MKKYGTKTLFASVLIAVSAASFAEDHYAEITKVSASKSFFGSSYSLKATVKSSDKDCGHYVNWWEAVSEDGDLLYRRVLGHPHSREQPFTRGGSTESINDETVFYVRAHMHPFGYSSQGMKGSIKTGFASVVIPDGFATNLANEGEKPSGCDAFKD